MAASTAWDMISHSHPSKQRDLKGLCTLLPSAEVGAALHASRERMPLLNCFKLGSSVLQPARTALKTHIHERKPQSKTAPPQSQGPPALVLAL